MAALSSLSWTGGTESIFELSIYPPGLRRQVSTQSFATKAKALINLLCLIEGIVNGKNGDRMVNG
jgi:hypothetical protein